MRLFASHPLQLLSHATEKPRSGIFAHQYDFTRGFVASPRSYTVNLTRLICIYKTAAVRSRCRRSRKGCLSRSESRFVRVGMRIEFNRGQVKKTRDRFARKTAGDSVGKNKTDIPRMTTRFTKKPFARRSSLTSASRIALNVKIISLVDERASLPSLRNLPGVMLARK